MDIRPVAYMEWAKDRPEAEFDLSLSGLAGPALADLRIDWSTLALNGVHPYGWPPLLEAVAARHGAEPRHVCPMVGTSQALFAVCAALLEPGDDVLVENPAYEPLLSVPRLLRASVRRFERRFEDGYRIGPDVLRAALRPGTRLVVMTNPHNPSGAALRRREIAALAAVAAEAGAALLVDEVYLEFLDGEEGRTAFGAAPNVAVVSSLTKAFGLGGLRSGWVLAPDDLAPRLRRLMDHMHVEHVLMAEQVAAQMFPRLDAMKAAEGPRIAANRAMVRELMGEGSGLEWVEPAAGIVGFPRLRGGGDASGLVRRLLEEHRTRVVPGRFFEAPRHFRLGFGIPAAELRKGLDGLRAALASGPQRS